MALTMQIASGSRPRWSWKSQLPFYKTHAPMASSSLCLRKHEARDFSLVDHLRASVTSASHRQARANQYSVRAPVRHIEATSSLIEEPLTSGVTRRNPRRKCAHLAHLSAKVGPFATAVNSLDSTTCFNHVISLPQSFWILLIFKSTVDGTQPSSSAISVFLYPCKIRSATRRSLSSFSFSSSSLVPSVSLRK